jgi:hypothetical protein
MIKNVIDILNANEFYGVSQRVEIAKGKYKYPTRFRDLWKKFVRYYKTKY